MKTTKEDTQKSYTLDELAELLHTTPEELTRKSEEAREEGKRIRMQEKETQKKIEKQIIDEDKSKLKIRNFEEVEKEIKNIIADSFKSEGKENLEITLPSGRKMNPSLKTTNKELEEIHFQNGEKLLKGYTLYRKELDSSLDKLLKENESLMNELFEIVGATEEQKERYLEAIDSDIELSEDLYFDIFGKSISGEKRFKGTTSELTKGILKELNASDEEIEETLKILNDNDLEEEEKREALKETLEGISDTNQEYIIKEKIIDFKNVEPKRIVSVLDKQMTLNEKAIEGMKNASKLNLSLMNLSNQFSIFTTNDKGEVIEDKKNKKGIELFIKISEEVLNSIATYNSFTKLAKKKNPSKLFAESYLEEKEQENETLKKLKEEILKQEEENQKTIQESEELFDYIPITLKNKIVTQEKVIPQLFVYGEKLKKIFDSKQEVKEKVTFDLVGDNEENWIVNCIMEQYPIEFTTHTFKTLESLMTIQNVFEKEKLPIIRRQFSTQDIIFLNKGGKVSKYTKEEYIRTNREITSLMSAVGKIDFFEFFKQYNKNRDEEQKIPDIVIKRLSGIQNFVYMAGLEIEYNDNGENQVNTFWHFTTNTPIVLFDFVKLTNRYTMLPLEMDSYLNDTELNQEITRVLKSIIASVRYYKTQKKKKPKVFLYHYFEGIETGKAKKEIYKPQEAIVLLKEKKLVGNWRYIISRTIDSIAKDCYFDEKRPLDSEKNLKGKERTRFIDSIVEYLRKAKEDKNILDFVLYTDKEKTIKEETYITEGQQRKARIKKKQKGTFKEGQRTITKRNPSIYKISIIIE